VIGRGVQSLLVEPARNLPMHVRRPGQDATSEG
jgi:hypothetical protein